MTQLLIKWAVTGALIVGSALQSGAWAHCDGLDGPVVQAARQALETGNVNYALIWVKPDVEGEVSQVFQQAIAVRKLSPDAMTLADRHFYETLVRFHRQGEGAAFTGLKPAGRDLGPAIPAADKAIDTGSADALAKLLTETMEEGLRERFAEVMAKKPFKTDEVAKGQQFVEAYVSFVHYVERNYDTATHKVQGHHPEP